MTGEKNNKLKKFKTEVKEIGPNTFRIFVCQGETKYSADIQARTLPNHHQVTELWNSQSQNFWIEV